MLLWKRNIIRKTAGNQISAGSCSKVFSKEPSAARCRLILRKLPGANIDVKAPAANDSDRHHSLKVNLPLRTQINHYSNSNGRFVAHFIVQIFCGLLSKPWFAVINAFAWMALVFCITRFSNNAKDVLKFQKARRFPLSCPAG